MTQQLIVELLPVYLSGEASATTKALVESCLMREQIDSCCVADFTLMCDRAREAFDASDQSVRA